MGNAKYSLEEVRTRGEALYRERVRDSVEPEHDGKFVVLDIKSGEYEVDEEDAVATKRLLARRPEAVLYGLRVGHRAAYHLGARAASSGS